MSKCHQTMGSMGMNEIRMDCLFRSGRRDSYGKESFELRPTWYEGSVQEAGGGELLVKGEPLRLRQAVGDRRKERHPMSLEGGGTGPETELWVRSGSHGAI